MTCGQQARLASPLLTLGCAGAVCSAQGVRPRPAPAPAQAGSIAAPASIISATPGTTVSRGGQPVQARAGTALKAGDVVQVGPVGNTDLRLRGHAALRLKPKSVLHLTGLPEAGAGQAAGDTRLRLEGGTALIRVRTLAGKGRFIIDTPSAVTAARGTGFLVDAEPQQTRVIVAEGHVAVSAPAAPAAELELAADRKAVVRGAIPAAAQAVDAQDSLRLAELQELPDPGGLRAIEGVAGAVLVNSIIVSPDGQKGLAAGSTGTITLFDPRSGRSLRVLRGHTTPVRALSFSLDGQRAYSAGTDGTIRVWDLGNGAERQQFLTPTGTVACLAPSRDGKFLLSCGDDGRVRTWDLTRGVGYSRGTYEDTSTSLDCVAASLDGRWVAAAGSDRTVSIWQGAGVNAAVKGRAILRAPARIRDLAFSPDSSMLLAGGENGALVAWYLRPPPRGNAPTGPVADVRGFYSSGAEIMRVAFMPDQSRVLSASRDAVVHVWDLASGRNVDRLERYSAGVPVSGYGARQPVGLSVSADGHTVYSGSGDGTLSVWWLPD